VSRVKASKDKKNKISEYSFKNKCIHPRVIIISKNLHFKFIQLTMMMVIIIRKNLNFRFIQLMMLSFAYDNDRCKIITPFIP